MCNIVLTYFVQLDWSASDAALTMGLLTPGQCYQAKLRMTSMSRHAQVWQNKYSGLLAQTADRRESDDNAAAQTDVTDATAAEVSEIDIDIHLLFLRVHITCLC